MRRMHEVVATTGHIFGLVVALLTGGPAEARAERGASLAERVFAQRILPIFNSPDPSSCTQCHLASVELKSYILPSFEKTFVSLRDQGLIDLARPMESKILKFIARGGDDPQGTSLLSAKVRKKEYDAFAAWIEASCRDPKLRHAAPLGTDEWAGPSVPDEVIRHGRVDRVLTSFIANIWSQRFRCSNCHSAEGKSNADLVRKHGEAVTWMRAKGAEATMRYLLENDLVNTTEPARSRFLRKAVGELDHGGGIKMRVGDAGYIALRRWIDDYARVTRGGYATAADLPKGPAWFGTEVWLRIKDLPAEWVGKLVAMAVYRVGEPTEETAKHPVAATKTIVEQNKDLGTFAHMTLYVALPPRTLSSVATVEQQPRLPPGTYRVRLFSVSADDAGGDLVAHGHEIARFDVEADWRTGFGNATVLSARTLRPH